VIYYKPNKYLLSSFLLKFMHQSNIVPFN
jgi:hypothetical protein